MAKFLVPDTPSMTKGEVECMTKYLSRASVYVEFGCGGSTLLAEQCGVSRLFSFESDIDWARAVRSKDRIAPRIENGTYRIEWIDLGATGEWGYPSDLTLARRWPNYSLTVWATLPAKPDLVLVDGRFRVSCVLQALAHCPRDTIIAVHDFERPEYAVILDYTEVIERVDNLILVRRRKAVDPWKFGIDCARYVMDPL